MKIVLSIILLALTPFFTLTAQEIPIVSHQKKYNNSLQRVQKQQYEEWMAEKKKQQVIKRALFLEKFKTLNADTVTELDMGDLGLTEMPNLSQFKKLKKIDASGNRIKHFKKRDFKSDSLRVIIISGNAVKRVCFPNNSQVEKLIMDNCRLKRIPCSVRKLKNLHSLELRKNQITKIPRFVKRRKMLTEVNLNFNSVIFNKRTVRRLATINRVLLAGNKIAVLPENIDKMTGVRNLNLANNNLSNVPTTLGRMDSLETIIFYKNNFSHIPSAIFNLKNLRELDFYYNHISTIPDSISLLKKLKRIYLSYNKLESLPAAIGKLKNLKILYIHHNRIKIIPDWITQLQALTILDVGYNRLISIPDLSKIKSLEEVDVQHNNLEDIPWSLLVKPGIKRVFLRDNPFIEDDNPEELKKIVEDQAAKGVEIFTNPQ